MLALIFFIAFPFLFISARKKITAARASATWPSVPGVITASERGRRMLRQYPRVAYSYVVNGQPLSGTKTTFSGVVAPKETDTYLARYPVGQPVNVYYSPAHSRHATAASEQPLRRGASAGGIGPRPRLALGLPIRARPWFARRSGISGAQNIAAPGTAVVCGVPLR